MKSRVDNCTVLLVVIFAPEAICSLYMHLNNEKKMRETEKQ
jgi:hypothetical protein